MKKPLPLQHDPFSRVRNDAAAFSQSVETRLGRIVALAWVADQLIATGEPRMVWAGNALKAGLEAEDARIGDLERKFLRISGGQGCTSSPAKVLRRIRRA